MGNAGMVMLTLAALGRVRIVDGEGFAVVRSWLTVVRHSGGSLAMVRRAPGRMRCGDVDGVEDSGGASSTTSESVEKTRTIGELQTWILVR